MIRTQQRFPVLKLEPTLSSQFAINNPRDYWTLFCWIMYFPQAIDYYIEFFVSRPAQLPSSEDNNDIEVKKEFTDLPELLSISRTISILTTFLFSLLFGAISSAAYSNNLTDFTKSLITFGGLTFVLSSFIIIVTASGASYMDVTAYSNRAYKAFIKGAVWLSIVSFTLAGMMISFLGNQRLEFIILFGIFFGASCGITVRLWPKIDAGEQLRIVAQSLLLICGVLSFGIVLAFFFAQGQDITGTFLQGFIGLTNAAIVAGAIILRPDDWLIGLIKCQNKPENNGEWAVPHVTIIPFFRVLSELENVLKSDWKQGLQYALELEQYTFQRPFINRIIRDELRASTKAQMLERVYALHLHPRFQERITEFAPKTDKPFRAYNRMESSRSLWKTSSHRRQDDFFVARKRLRIHWNTDSPTRAAIAGFYYLERLYFQNAKAAFQSQSLDKKDYGVFGKEICDLCDMMISLNNKKVADEAPLKLLERPTKSSFKEAWDALAELQQFVRCLWVYDRCRDHDNRQEIAGIGSRYLNKVRNELSKHGEDKRAKEKLFDNQYEQAYPFEYALRRRAETWLEDIRHDPDFSAKDLKPIDNPFSFVEPLQDSRLLALRADILQKFKAAWKPGNFQPVLLYGQRQIGKTSVINSAIRDESIKAQTMVVYVNLQHLDARANHVEIIEAIIDEIQEKFQYISPPIEERLLRSPYHTFQLYIRQFCSQIKPKGLVVVLDEFDHIDSIAHYSGTQDNFLAYLWELSQSEYQLGFVFITPRTPTEIQNIYDNPFTTGLSPVKVSYVNNDNTEEILQKPTDNFLPYFHPNAIQEIIRHTGGHPYLVQIIAYCIVEEFNGQIEIAQNASTKDFPDPLFLESDITRIVQHNLDFRARSLRYFENVLRETIGNNLDCEKLLRRLACARQGFSTTDLRLMMLNPDDRDMLADHDVIQWDSESSRWQINIGLLRDAIPYPFITVERGQRQQFVNYQNQPQLLSQIEHPQHFDSFMLWDTEIYAQIRGDRRFRAVLARCSIWEREDPLKQDNRSAALGHLAFEDKAVAVQLLYDTIDRLRRDSFIQIFSIIDPSTFWRMRFGRFIPERFPNDYRERTGFVPYANYFSMTVELDEAITLLSRFDEIVEQSEFVFEPLNIDEPETDLRQIHELITDIHLDNTSQIRNPCRDDLLFFSLSYADFEQQYRPILTHSRRNLITLAKKDGEVVGCIIAYDEMNLDADVNEQNNLLLLKTVAVRSEYSHTSLADELIYNCYQQAVHNNFLQVRHEFVRSADNYSALTYLRTIAESQETYVVYRRKLYS